MTVMEQPKSKLRTLAILSSLLLGGALVYFGADWLLGVQSSKSTFMRIPSPLPASPTQDSASEPQPGSINPEPSQDATPAPGQPPASPPSP
jgi:hypothetical protein